MPGAARSATAFATIFGSVQLADKSSTRRLRLVVKEFLAQPFDYPFWKYNYIPSASAPKLTHTWAICRCTCDPGICQSTHTALHPSCIRRTSTSHRMSGCRGAIPMCLTPVRVRGKRKTPSTSKPPGTLRQHEEQEQQHPSKKPKRSLSTVMATRTSRARANLDTLPSEILETILLYSANLSLPNCTPLIGLKLSERATLLRFFIWAFHETWLQVFVHGPPVNDGRGGPQGHRHGDYALQVCSYPPLHT